MKTAPTLKFPPDVPIWIDPERLSGAPCFKGTRVPVDSLFTNLESGLSLDEYLDCFPDVTREQAAFPAKSLHDYKFWPHVSRVDNVFGDRNPVCSCAGMENYSS